MSPYTEVRDVDTTNASLSITVSVCLFQYTFLFGFCVALSWSVLVCVSRVYMGMHSVLVSLSSCCYQTLFFLFLVVFLFYFKEVKAESREQPITSWFTCLLQEVITGFLYTLLILAFLCPLLETIDTFYMTGRYAPLAIVVSHVSLGLVAFSLDSWSTSRGDTAQALGTGAGAALATHVNHQLGLMLDPPLSSLPLTARSVTVPAVALSMLRFLVGVAVLLLTRMVMKAVTVPLLCRLFGLPSDNVRQARQHMRVELPYRYIVYSVVGFSCVCVVPLLFRAVNLA